jgi:hypothetical protein
MAIQHRRIKLPQSFRGHTLEIAKSNDPSSIQAFMALTVLTPKYLSPLCPKIFLVRLTFGERLADFEVVAEARSQPLEDLDFVLSPSSAMACSGKRQWLRMPGR